MDCCIQLTLPILFFFFLEGSGQHIFSIQTASNGIGLLITGRIIAGFGVGIASTVVPVYQAEIAPPEIRGRVISLQQWAITWGILVQYFIQYGASFVDGGPKNPRQGTAAFRIPWAIQTIPAFILFFGLFFFPKSPRWLAGQDRWEEAIRVLADLHGGGDMNHPKVLAQYQEIEEALTFERDESKSSLACRTNPAQGFRNLLIGLAESAHPTKNVAESNLRNVDPDVVSTMRLVPRSNGRSSLTPLRDQCVNVLLCLHHGGG